MYHKIQNELAKSLSLSSGSLSPRKASYSSWRRKSAHKWWELSTSECVAGEEGRLGVEASVAFGLGLSQILLSLVRLFHIAYHCRLCFLEYFFFQ